jgi:tetratricopeptide (TPR) repeat protein
VDALTALVAKSMVVPEPAADGPARFQLLETMRQYAREQLDNAAETDHWRRRLAEYCAVFAEQAGAGLQGRDEFLWRTRLYDELDNLRAAVAWSLDRDDPDDTNLALRIISALVVQSVFDNPRGVGVWAQRALPKLDHASPQLGYAVTAAAAWHLFSGGDYERARQLAVLAVADGVPPNSSAPAAGHAVLGFMTALLGDPQAAIALLSDALRALEATAPNSADASWLHSLVATIGVWERNPIASIEAEHAVRIARELANPSLLANALFAQGWTLTDSDPAAARAALEESISYARQGAAPIMLGPALFRLAVVEMRTRDAERAASTLRESIERCHEIGDRSPYFTSIWCGVELLAEHQHFQESATFAGIVSEGLPTPFLTVFTWETQQAALERVRHELGEAAYEAAFSRGRTMTYDESLHYALAALDDLAEEI